MTLPHGRQSRNSVGTHVKTFALSLLAACAYVHASHGALLPPVFTPGGGLVKAPSAVTIANPNSAGTIFYTVDGTDPRDGFGNVAPSARSYERRIVLNRPLQVRARVKSAAEWSEIAAAAFTTDQDFSFLLFTEMMYHPQSTSDLTEFLELKNVGSKPLDLTGLEFQTFNVQGQVSGFHIFEAGTIVRPGEFLVLASDAVTFHQAYPGARLDIDYFGQLRNSGFTMVAIQSVSSRYEVASARYGTAAPWPAVPDNHSYFPDDAVGFSLVRVNYDPTVDPMDHRAWRASTSQKGSPGADDPAPLVSPIYVNELLTRSSTGAPDTVEIHNPNPFSVDISRWWLSDERNDPQRFSIPDGTVIPPFGYLVLDEAQFGVGPKGIAFSADGERCYLFSADPNGILTGYSHGLQFPPSDRDVTFGRHVASDGTETFPPQIGPTFGSANSGPRISPVVISEVMYHPIDGELQYIELSNTSSAPVDLWDPLVPQNTWWVGDSRLPPGTTIPANGFLLVVDDDPPGFRAKYGVPPNVPIVTGQPLPDSEVHLPLLRPSGTLSNGAARQVEVDRVIITDRPPWPPGADGGPSLERIDLQGYGSDPKNWRVSPTGGSPGRPNSGNLPPAVWAGADRIEFLDSPAPLTSAIADEAWPGSVLTAAWEQLSGPASVEFSGASATQTTAVFPLAGQYVLRLNASDGTFSLSDTLTINVIERPFDLWQSNVFTPVELSDPAVAGPAADPDADGRPNLAEYLFDSQPTVADRDATHGELSNGRLQIRWRQRSETPDVLAIPERADRLEGPWFSSPELFDRSEVDLGALREITVWERLPISGRAAGFLRLRLQPR